MMETLLAIGGFLFSLAVIRYAMILMFKGIYGSRTVPQPVQNRTNEKKNISHKKPEKKENAALHSCMLTKQL